MKITDCSENVSVLAVLCFYSFQNLCWCLWFYTLLYKYLPDAPSRQFGSIPASNRTSTMSLRPKSKHTQYTQWVVMCLVWHALTLIFLLYWITLGIVGRCWSVSSGESSSSGRSSWSSMRRCWGKACPTAPPRVSMKWDWLAFHSRETSRADTVCRCTSWFLNISQVILLYTFVNIRQYCPIPLASTSWIMLK